MFGLVPQSTANTVFDQAVSASTVTVVSFGVSGERNMESMCHPLAVDGVVRPDDISAVYSPSPSDAGSANKAS